MLNSPPFYQIHKEGILLTFPHVGNFCVDEKGNVSFERESSLVSDTVIDGYLNGSVQALAETMKGNVVFHGGLVRVKGDYIGFLGDSGMGKSTLFAEMLNHVSTEVLADDLLVFSDPDNPAMMSKPSKHIRLWKESLGFTSSSPEDLVKIHPVYDKMNLPISTVDVAFPSLPDAFVILEFGASLGIKKLNQSEAFKNLMAQLKCKELLSIEQQVAHFRLCSLMATTLPVFVLTRPLGLEFVSDTVRFIKAYDF